MLDVFKKIKPK